MVLHTPLLKTLSPEIITSKTKQYQLFAYAQKSCIKHIKQNVYDSYGSITMRLRYTTNNTQFEASLQRTNGLVWWGNCSTGLRNRFSHRSTKVFCESSHLTCSDNSCTAVTANDLM